MPWPQSRARRQLLALARGREKARSPNCNGVRIPCFFVSVSLQGLQQQHPFSTCLGSASFANQFRTPSPFVQATSAAISQPPRDVDRLASVIIDKESLVTCDADNPDVCSICTGRFQHGQTVCRVACVRLFHSDFWNAYLLKLNKCRNDGADRQLGHEGEAATAAEDRAASGRHSTEDSSSNRPPPEPFEGGSSWSGRGPDREPRVRRTFREECTNPERPLDWSNFDIGLVVRAFRTNLLGRIKMTLRKLHLRWWHTFEHTTQKFLERVGVAQRVIDCILG